MAKTAILSVRIVSDAKKAVAGFQQAAGGLDKLEGRLKKIAGPMTAASAGVIALGKQSLDAASALQQSTGAVESVFKSQAESIKAFAADAANAVGLSANQYQEFASVMGAQLKNLGVEQAALVPTTDKLITLGADLASMFGGTTAEAVEALSAAFRGETDPIERYGISIKKSDINARLAAEGLSHLEGEALRQAETQAMLAMLTEQSADAMGNFGRETGTAAGSAQIAAAHWENAKAALGEALLPIATAAAQKMTELASAMAANPGAVQAIGAAILVLTGIIYGLIGVVKVYTAVQTILNAVMAANPIMLVVLAVVALVAIFVVAYQRSETFRAGVQIAGMVGRAAFDAIKSAVMAAVAKVSEIIARVGGVGGAFRRAMSAAATGVSILMSPLFGLIGLIGRVISAIAGIRFPSPPAWMSRLTGAAGVGWPGGMLGVPGAGVFRFMAPPTLTAAAVPSLTAARSPSLTDLTGGLASPGGRVTVDQSVHVTVDGSGIVDPRKVADAVRAVFRDDNRTRGRGPAGGGGTWQ